MKRLAILIVFGILLLSTNSWATEAKIGVVDIQTVVRNSQAGQEALKKLQAKFETLKAKLQKKESELRKFKAELEKKAPLLSPEARKEKEREYQKMLREYQAAREDAQFEMKQEEEKALKPIMQDLDKIIKDMAKKEGYDLILEKKMPGLYWASEKIDITKHLIELYNKYWTTKKK
ncbi:OmpH family outer membrane protein [Thermodesulfatator indicus]